MDQADFTTVLGHPRVLSGPQTDARTRVLAYDGTDIVGIAMYEPLYGRHGEAAIAVAAGSPSGLISYLFDNLVELARDSGVTVLRFAISPGSQRALASRLTRSCATTSLRSDRLELRLQPDDHLRGSRGAPPRSLAAAPVPTTNQAMA